MASSLAGTSALVPRSLAFMAHGVSSEGQSVAASTAALALDGCMLHVLLFGAEAGTTCFLESVLEETLCALFLL